MQKPPSPHRWGLAHSFRSEREEGGANGVQGTAEGIPRAVRRRAPPQPLSPGALASTTQYPPWPRSPTQERPPAPTCRR